MKKYITTKKMRNDIQKFLSQYNDNDDGFKSDAAYNIIMESVIWGSRNHFEALGILQEAIMRYREVSLEILSEDGDD